jgi:hypothetical protein
MVFPWRQHVSSVFFSLLVKCKLSYGGTLILVLLLVFYATPCVLKCCHVLSFGSYLTFCLSRCTFLLLVAMISLLHFLLSTEIILFHL